jgi:HTH-type transcriptional regulator / antitoxin MqsA
MMTETACHICGNQDFEDRLVEYIYRRQGLYLVVRNVPCEVCLHCGERYYAGETILEIERRFKAIYRQKAKPQALVSVPIEEYAGVH